MLLMYCRIQQLQELNTEDKAFWKTMPSTTHEVSFQTISTVVSLYYHKAVSWVRSLAEPGLSADTQAPGCTAVCVCPIGTKL